jgi:hypothetical protein
MRQPAHEVSFPAPYVSGMTATTETLPENAPGRPRSAGVFHRRTVPVAGLEQALVDSAARLSRAYPAVPAAEIRERLEAEAQTLQTRVLVTTFVPVLAERKVAAALRKATLAPNTPARPHSEPHRPAA